MIKSVALLNALMLVVMALNVYGSDFPIPEFYGTYALSHGKLIEIQNAKQYYGFDKNVKFIFFGKWVAMMPTGNVVIRKNVFVRNVISQNMNGSVRVDPYQRWARSSQPAIGTHSKPVPNQPEQIYIAPISALTAGAYELDIGDSPRVYFFVGESAEELQSGIACVDVRTGMYANMLVGNHGQEMPCNTNASEKPNDLNKAIASRVIGNWVGRISDASSYNKLSMVLKNNSSSIITGTAKIEDPASGLKADGTVSDFGYSPTNNRLTFVLNYKYGNDKPYPYSCTVKATVTGNFVSNDSRKMEGHVDQTQACDWIDPKKGKQSRARQETDKISLTKSG